MRCLAVGNWQESLRYNALAVPMAVLFAVTVGWLGVQLAAQRKLSLPLWVLQIWGVLLIVAWIFKLAGDPNYW